MIELEQRVDIEAVGAIITNLSKAVHNNSYNNKGESMPGLQEKAREDSSSSEGASIPFLQEWAKEDSFSDDDTDSYGEDGKYDDCVLWGYKTPTLSQIIKGNSGGLFPNNRPYKSINKKTPLSLSLSLSMLQHSAS